MPILFKDYLEDETLLEAKSPKVTYVFPESSKNDNETFIKNFLELFFRYLDSNAQIDFNYKDFNGILISENSFKIRKGPLGKSDLSNVFKGKKQNRFYSFVEDYKLDSEFVLKQILIWLNKSQDSLITFNPNSKLSQDIKSIISSNPDIYTQKGSKINQTDLSWNEFTLETAQLVGVFTRDNSFITKLEDILKLRTPARFQKREPEIADLICLSFPKIFNTFESICNSELKYDKGIDVLFEPNSYFMPDLDQANIVNFVTMGTQILGGYKFKQKLLTLDKDFKDLHLVHKSIDTYYKFEKRFINREDKHSKDNTSDYLLYSPVKGIFFEDILKNESKWDQYKLDYNNDTGICYVIDKNTNTTIIKYLQCSAKKGMNDARLGKITSYIQNLIGNFTVSSYFSQIKTEINENFISVDDYYDTNSILEMNLSDIKDSIKSSINKIKSVFKVLYTKIKGSLSGLIKSLFTKKTINSLILDLLNKLNLSPSTQNINLDRIGILNEDINTEIDRWFSTGENLKQVVSLVEKRKYELINSLEENSTVLIKENLNERFSKTNKSIIIKTKDLPNIEITPEITRQLFANYIAFSILPEIFKLFIKDNSDIVNNLKYFISDLTKETILGKTILPVYKVYGIFSLEDESEELLTYKTTKNVKAFDHYIQTDSNIPLIYLYILPTRDKGKTFKTYYQIVLYTLYGYDEFKEEFNYMRISLTTGGSIYNFKLEADKLVPSSKLMNLEETND